MEKSVDGKGINPLLFCKFLSDFGQTFFLIQKVEDGVSDHLKQRLIIYNKV